MVWKVKIKTVQDSKVSVLVEFEILDDANAVYSTRQLSINPRATVPEILDQLKGELLTAKLCKALYDFAAPYVGAQFTETDLGL